MNEEVKKYYDEINDIFGLPQIYKGIKFYPLKITEIKYISFFRDIFMYPKVALDKLNPAVFKMDYLKFVLYVLPNVLKQNEEGLTFEEEIKDFLFI
jgi:hypothetical protein